MKNIRQYFAFAAAILIACVAAYFSITGLSKLFAGAVIPVIIMASALEIGKIVAASFVQRHGKEIGIFKKIGLSIFVVILMIITSIGIYGFLTDAYQKTSNKFENIEKQTEIIEKKESLIKSQIKRNEDLIASRAAREKTLTSLRTNQESRLDTFLNRNRSASAKNAQNSISDANEEIKQINLDINRYNSEINVLNDSVNVFENQKLVLSNNDAVAEIGPLKYISTLTGKPMDVVVNYLILALIFVFDPLAVLLLISSQSIKDVEEIEVPNDVPENVEEEKFEEEFIAQKEENRTASDMPEVFIEPLNDTVSEPVNDTVNDTVNDDVNDAVNDVDKKETVVKKFEDFEIYYKEQLSNIKKYRTKFEELIDILYNDGRIKAGQNLRNYVEFEKIVDETFVTKFSTDDIRRFLAMCNYLKIASLNHGERKAIMEFDEAKEALRNFLKE